jgi:hypothetical protein
MDFVHDQLATGRKLRVLTIVGTFSRFSPAVEARFTFRGADVVSVLERLATTVGLPKAIRVDQGTEFRLARSQSMGLSTWRHARPQSAGKADRQCVHRVSTPSLAFSLRVVEVMNQWAFKHSARNLPLKDFRC